MSKIDHDTTILLGALVIEIILFILIGIFA